MENRGILSVNQLNTMNDYSNVEANKNRPPSIARIALVIGLLFGALITLGVFWFFRLTAPHQLGGDFPSFLLVLVSIPTAILCRIFRFSLHLATDNGHGGSSNQWSVPAVCLVTFVNALLVSTLAWWLGTLLQHRKTKPQ